MSLINHQNYYFLKNRLIFGQPLKFIMIFPDLQALPYPYTPSLLLVLQNFIWGKREKHSDKVKSPSKKWA